MAFGLWLTADSKKVNLMKIQLIIAIVLCLFGVVLIGVSFVVPPLGVIDNSVLVAFGEVLTFSGSLMGIDYKYRKRS